MSSPEDGRPRRRSEASRRAILAAAHDLVREHGFDQLTIEAVAARAGVGKQTIYRWWTGRGALAIEAFMDAARPHIAFPDTGDLARDLATVLEQVAALLSSPDVGPHAASFLAETVRDPAARDAFRTFVLAPVRATYLARLEAARDAGQLAADVTPDDVLDAAFGPLWFRLLTRPDQVGPGTGAVMARIVARGAITSPGATAAGAPPAAPD